MPSYPSIIEKKYRCEAPSEAPELGTQELFCEGSFSEGAVWGILAIHVYLKGIISFAEPTSESPKSSSGNQTHTGSNISYSSEYSYLIVTLLSFQLISFAFDEGLE